MNNPRYLLDGKPISAIDLIANAAHAVSFKRPAARELIQAAIHILKADKHTVAGRKWNAEAACYADELEKVDV